LGSKRGDERAAAAVRVRFRGDPLLGKNFTTSSNARARLLMDRAGFNCTRAENRKFRVIVAGKPVPVRLQASAQLFRPMTWILGPLNGLQLTLILFFREAGIFGRYLQIAQENEIHTP
jgi:hypothetical protein